MRNPFKRRPSEKDIKNYLNQKGLMVMPESEQVIRALMTTINGQPIFFDDQSKEYVDRGYLSNADVYSIVRQISRSCSLPTWGLFEVKNEKALRDYKLLKLTTSNTEAQMFKLLKLRAKALDEIEEDHDSLKIFNKPNPLQNWTEFYELSITFRLITGNRYWKGVAPQFGTNQGKYQEIYILPSQFTEILAGKGFTEPVGGYRLNFKPTIQFEADEVSHSKYPNPNYDTFGRNLYGLSPLRPGKKVLVKSNDGYTASAALLQSFGAIGMIANKGDSDLDIDQLQKLIIQKYSGPANRGRVLTTNYNLEYTKMGMSAVDLALNEGQMLTLRQLCNIYNYPSELVNDKESNKFNSHKEAKKSAFINAAVPELNLDRDDFNNWYIQPYSKADNKNYFLDYDITDIPELQEDLEKLWSRIDASEELTPNEKRKIKGYEELNLPGMDTPWFTANKMPIDQMLSTETGQFENDLTELEEEINKSLNGEPARNDF